MKKFSFITMIAALLLSIFGCNKQQSDQLTQQQKNQIMKEIKVVNDSVIAKYERLDAVGGFQYYIDSPDWGMVNADGSRWDFQYTKKILPDFFNSITSFKWTTTHQDFKFLTKDIILCAWDGKDVTLLKSGDKITCDPHAYTLVFKKVAGQWKVIYSHDSGIPVTQKAEKK
jgi:hypothetical protein